MWVWMRVRDGCLRESLILLFPKFQEVSPTAFATENVQVDDVC